MADSTNGQNPVASPSPAQLDHNAVKYVILFLGWFAILGLIAVAFLLAQPTMMTVAAATATEPAKTIPVSKPDLAALITLVGTAAGALGAMLAQTSTSRAPVQTSTPQPTDSTVIVTGPKSVTQGQTANYQAMMGGNSIPAQWSATAGQIQADPTDSSKAVFTAPAMTATVTITATKTDDTTKTGKIQVQVP